MERVDLRIEGADAEDAAALLRIPALEDGTWGWRGLLAPAAALRELRIVELKEQLGFELTIRKEPRHA